MYLATVNELHFCRFTFKNTPSCSFKYFESSDVIVVLDKYKINFCLLITRKYNYIVRKFSLKKLDLKIISFCFSYILTRVKKKIKWLVAERLDVQTEQTRILI